VFEHLREDMLDDLNDHLSARYGWIDNIEEPTEEYIGTGAQPRYGPFHFDFSEQLIVTLMIIFWANLFSGIILKWLDFRTSSILTKKNLRRADEELRRWMDSTYQHQPVAKITPEVAQIRTRLLKRLEMLRDNDPLLFGLLPKWEDDLSQVLGKHGWPEDVAKEDAKHLLSRMLQRAQDYGKSLSGRVGGVTPLDYNLGLERCFVAVTDADQEIRLQFATLEARLRENLYSESTLGSTETLRSERARILLELNRLCMGQLGSSFNDLCVEKHGYE
jgi:hypothetical protein